MSISTLAFKAIRALRALTASENYARMSKDEQVKAIADLMRRGAPSASIENAMESLNLLGDGE